MELKLINAAQVEWLVRHQPETSYSYECNNRFLTGIKLRYFDIYRARCETINYYLTTETYNQLPTEFKQLSQC